MQAGGGRWLSFGGSKLEVGKIEEIVLYGAIAIICRLF
jgi:hypothetical protein